MAYIQDAGSVDTRTAQQKYLDAAKKASLTLPKEVQSITKPTTNTITPNPTNINSFGDLSNWANTSLVNANNQGIKPDAGILAKGGLTQQDYNNTINGLTQPQMQPQTQPQSQQQPQQVVPTQTQPTFDMNGYIQKLTDAQKQKQLADLQNAYNKNVSTLNSQDAKIDPQAYIDRGIKSTASQLNAKNFAEFMAQRGQTNSGVAGQSELNRNMQLQGDVGAIDLQARNAHNDISTKKTDFSTALQNDIASANAGIEADSLRMLIDQANADRGFNYQVGRDTVNDTGKLSNGEYTQAGLLNQSNIAMNQAQLKEKTDPNSITNQMAQLGLDTAKLNFAALPQQIQNETTQTLQSIQKGDIDISTGKAQLKELTDPNSITNQMAKIGLDTAKLNYQALPQTIKNEALLLAQDVQKGTIDIKVANAQLKELTNPNSITNQMNQLGLQTAKLNYQALPAQLKGEADKLAQELRAGNIDIQTAQKQLNNLKSGLTKDGKAATTKPPMTAAQIGAAKMKIMESLIQKDEDGKVISYPTDETVNARFESFYGFSPNQTTTQPLGLQW